MLFLFGILILCMAVATPYVGPRLLAYQGIKRYRQTLRNIERLEREMGIGLPPPQVHEEPPLKRVLPWNREGGALVPIHTDFQPNFSPAMSSSCATYVRQVEDTLFYGPGQVWEVDRADVPKTLVLPDGVTLH